MLTRTGLNNEELYSSDHRKSKVDGFQGWLSKGSKIRSRMRYLPSLCSAICGLPFFWTGSYMAMAVPGITTGHNSI